MTFGVNFEPGTLNMTLFHNDEPFLYQPHHPNGNAWNSRDEAIAWAEECYVDWVKANTEEPQE